MGPRLTFQNLSEKILQNFLKYLALFPVVPYMTTLLPMKPQDDSLATRWSLVARMKNPEDQETWSEFADLYRGLIFGVARKAGLREEEAKDVVQETMAAVAKNIGGFE